MISHELLLRQNLTLHLERFITEAWKKYFNRYLSWLDVVLMMGKDGGIWPWVYFHAEHQKYTSIGPKDKMEPLTPRPSLRPTKDTGKPLEPCSPYRFTTTDFLGTQSHASLCLRVLGVLSLQLQGLYLPVPFKSICKNGTAVAEKQNLSSDDVGQPLEKLKVGK